MRQVWSEGGRGTGRGRARARFTHAHHTRAVAKLGHVGAWGCSECGTELELKGAKKVERQGAEVVAVADENKEVEEEGRANGWMGREWRGYRVRGSQRVRKMNSSMLSVRVLSGKDDTRLDVSESERNARGERELVGERVE